MNPKNPKTQDRKSREGKKSEEKQKEQKNPAAETLEAQVQRLTDLAARAQADLQNYKQRAERDAKQTRQFASATIMTALLPVFDDLHRLRSHLSASDGIAEGFDQMVNKLDTILQDCGLVRIHPHGQAFDPHCHDVLQEAPGKKDTVIEVYEDGYELDGKMLRPAKVCVGNGEENL